MRHRPEIWRFDDDANAHVLDWHRLQCSYCKKHHDTRLACIDQFKGLTGATIQTLGFDIEGLFVGGARDIVIRDNVFIGNTQ